MGKKVTTASRALPKIAKKQQAAMSRSSSSLMMKVLRPRVYITDVTNFKKLVQGLTGISNVPSSRPIPHNAHIPCPPQLRRDSITTAMIVEDSDPVLRSGDAQIWYDFQGLTHAMNSYFSGESSWHPQLSQTYEPQLNNDALLTFGDIEGWLMDIDSAPSWESALEVDACDFLAREL